MKKTYIAPDVQTLVVRTIGMIASSNSITTTGDSFVDDLGGLGGVDVSGTLDPSAHEGGLFDEDNSFDMDFD